jgi:HNH endonuclease
MRVTYTLQKKICTACHVSKPMEEFRSDKYRIDGKTLRCRKCLKEAGKEFEKRRIRPPAYYVRCKARYRERRATELHVLKANWQRSGKAYRQKHPTKRSDYDKSHPEIQANKHRRRRAAKLSAPLNDFTPEQWEEMKAACGFRCTYCGKKRKQLTQDHITPLIKGGSHTASNIVPACLSCNSIKHDGDILGPVQPMLLLVAPSKPFQPRQDT